MKINPFLSVLALLLAALIAYALYYYCKSEELVWALTIGGGISIFLPWAGTLGVSLEDKRMNVNFKVLNALCALIITSLQLFFAFHAPALPKYLLISGVVLILWLSIAYAMARKK
jgi:hypothetical protein